MPELTDIERTAPKWSLSDTEELACKKCGNVFFRQVTQVRRLSAIKSPTGQEEILTVGALKCDECGEIFKPTSIISAK
jgi:hypothetical protein